MSSLHCLFSESPELIPKLSEISAIDSVGNPPLFTYNVGGGPWHT